MKKLISIRSLKLPQLEMAVFKRQYIQHRTEAHRILRFLLTGGWNTVFGILVYAGLYELLHEKAHYLALMIPANILAITNAYICYKLFVFKTKGNVIREYLRFYVVYGASIVMSFVLMFLLVDGLGLHPIVSQILCTAITIACSYIGHRYFSFRLKTE
ncbi:MAG: GtrA family protein [Victivallaceae bacterium]|nr:GtrA family protein [Victivallaceae bacterium]